MSENYAQKRIKLFFKFYIKINSKTYILLKYLNSNINLFNYFKNTYRSGQINK